MERIEPKLVFFNLTEDGNVFRTDDGPKLNLFSPIVVKTVELPHTLNYTMSVCFFDVDKSVKNILLLQFSDAEGNLVHEFENVMNEAIPEASQLDLLLYGHDNSLTINSPGVYKVEAFLNKDNKVATTYFLIGEKN
jgi:hypothetical protein